MVSRSGKAKKIAAAQEAYLAATAGRTAASDRVVAAEHELMSARAERERYEQQVDDAMTRLSRLGAQSEPIYLSNHPKIMLDALLPSIELP